MNTANQIRNAFNDRYPDVNDDEYSVGHSGFIHEHPLTAIGVVLISSVVLGTTDIDCLAEFSSYSRKFIRTIEWNMKTTVCWKNGKYEARWSSRNLLPRNQSEDDEFWAHIDIAAGDMWSKDAESDDSEDPCAVFWDMKLVN